MVADGVEIPAHKMVLASCSPYFYAMFTSFTESKAEKITIQGVDGQALQILVDYVYSSEIQVTEDNVQVIHLLYIIYIYFFLILCLKFICLKLEKSVLVAFLPTSSCYLYACHLGDYMII